MDGIKLCKWCYKELHGDEPCDCSMPEKDEEQLAFEKIMDECKELRWRKNLDYGGAYKVCGTKGIVVRLVDKVMRMKNLLLDNNQPTVKETIKQNLMDIVVLAANALYLENGGK